MRLSQKRYVSRAIELIICDFASSLSIAVLHFVVGTTWASAIVVMIVNDADPACMTSGPTLKHRIPYLEMPIPDPVKVQIVQTADHLAAAPGTTARVYATHLPPFALPPSIVDSAKVSLVTSTQTV